MKITFKEFKAQVSNTASVYVGSFLFAGTKSWNEESSKARRFQNSFVAPRIGREYCFGIEAIKALPLADGYKLDMYTDGVYSWEHRINTESDVVLKADRVYIIAPTFVTDIAKAYKRKHKYCINGEVLASASDELRTWMQRSGYLTDKNQTAVMTGLVSIDLCTDDANECTMAVRRTLRYAERAFDKALSGQGITKTEYLAWVAESERAGKEAEKEEKARRKARAKEQAYINEHIHVYDYDIAHVLCHALNVGTNTGSFSARLADKNGVECDEAQDNKTGYSRSCGYTMIRRSFTLNMKKGYNLYVIGGLITFVRGKVKREGVACEWIEQGRAIADIRTVKGYLVRGEHIEAKNLRAAQQLSKARRDKQASELLASRARKQRSEELLAGHMFTFAESLASGNCRPGTQSFKVRYEAAIGHEANEISLADLRKYGSAFGLEYYTERVINYVMRSL